MHSPIVRGAMHSPIMRGATFQGCTGSAVRSRCSRRAGRRTRAARMVCMVRVWSVLVRRPAPALSSRPLAAAVRPRCMRRAGRRAPTDHTRTIQTIRGHGVCGEQAAAHPQTIRGPYRPYEVTVYAESRPPRTSCTCTRQQRRAHRAKETETGAVKPCACPPCRALLRRGGESATRERAAVVGASVVVLTRPPSLLLGFLCKADAAAFARGFAAAFARGLCMLRGMPL
jgi:hypothetical protein